ncbi:MAG: hypothetical protein IKI20_03495 [Lachnospiraceae bacterium]|nr:hypothetical protein [Lachnospiraceae bacterium]
MNQCYLTEDELVWAIINDAAYLDAMDGMTIQEVVDMYDSGATEFDDIPDLKKGTINVAEKALTINKYVEMANQSGDPDLIAKVNELMDSKIVKAYNYETADGNGVYCNLIEIGDREPKEVIASFRGTNAGMEAVTEDAAIGLIDGYSTEQMKYIPAIMNDIGKRYQGTDYTISTTGHSLGAFDAEVAALTICGSNTYGMDPEIQSDLKKHFGVLLKIDGPSGYDEFYENNADGFNYLNDNGKYCVYHASNISVFGNCPPIKEGNEVFLDSEGVSVFGIEFGMHPIFKYFSKNGNSVKVFENPADFYKQLVDNLKHGFDNKDSNGIQSIVLFAIFYNALYGYLNNPADFYNNLIQAYTKFNIKIPPQLDFFAKLFMGALKFDIAKALNYVFIINFFRRCAEKIKVDKIYVELDKLKLVSEELDDISASLLKDAEIIKAAGDGLNGDIISNYIKNRIHSCASKVEEYSEKSKSAGYLCLLSANKYSAAENLVENKYEEVKSVAL